MTVNAGYSLQGVVYVLTSLGGCLAYLLMTGGTCNVNGGISVAALPFATGVAKPFTHPIAAGTRPGPGAIRELFERLRGEQPMTYGI